MAAAIITSSCNNSKRVRRPTFIISLMNVRLIIWCTHIVSAFLHNADSGGEGLVGGLDLQHAILQVQVILLDEVHVVHAYHLPMRKQIVIQMNYYVAKSIYS